MPIAPNYFDRSFEGLGVGLVTSQKCSWENYCAYNLALNDVRALLAARMDAEVSLLDAHSFVWMLSAQMADEPEPRENSAYKKLTRKEREAVIKARIGQGRFRTQVVEFWSGCAVTGCHALELLTSSHIKPWRSCNLREATDPFNGLLLAPSLDAAFDEGLISFSDVGKIIVSPRLSRRDATSLGITDGLCLSRVDPRHRKYLKYHRNELFKRT